MGKGIPKNQVRSMTAMAQDEHCDDADAKRVKIVDEDGEPINDTNPLPTSVQNVSVSTQITRKDDDPNAGDLHDSTRIGNQDVELDFKDTGNEKGDARVTDSLHLGGTNTVIEVKDIPVEIKVGTTAKSDRSTLIAVPKAKGVFWGFKANVDTTNGPNGGIELGKSQILVVDSEANTPIFLIGPASGVFVSIAEA